MAYEQDWVGRPLIQWTCWKKGRTVCFLYLHSQKHGGVFKPVVSCELSVELCKDLFFVPANQSPATSIVEMVTIVDQV